jgi:hypothetical protein
MREINVHIEKSSDNVTLKWKMQTIEERAELVLVGLEFEF